ncbi:unnamed protein product [Hydatigera taeniaeformis]|uniref:Uncharacterized protein n=1 Tax=Hydatigena taeniaeformis TaxID=6205 RepID=A0A3P7FQ24_HYDTA|nr:unnamed protein product [Hydatigera taeniaeformis]
MSGQRQSWFAGQQPASRFSETPSRTPPINAANHRVPPHFINDARSPNKQTLLPFVPSRPNDTYLDREISATLTIARDPSFELFLFGTLQFNVRNKSGPAGLSSPAAGLAPRSPSANTLPNPSSPKNGDFQTHIRPLLLDIQRMYENVAANHSFCIDSLTRSFDRADVQIAGFTKSFVIELTQQILSNDPAITVERKEQAIRRAMSRADLSFLIRSPFP